MAVKEPASAPAQKALQEFLMVCSSFAIFLMFLRIRAPGRGEVRFERWAHLVKIAQRLEKGDSICVLKARQIGLSWLLAAYAIWIAITKPQSVILILSKDQDAANAVLERAMFMHDRLPAHLKRKVIAQNKSEAEFDTGSVIRSLPSTPNAGRGFTANVILVDEAAFHPFGHRELSGVPTSPSRDGGQLVMVLHERRPRGTLLYHLRSRQARCRSSGIHIPPVVGKAVSPAQNSRRNHGDQRHWRSPFQILTGSKRPKKSSREPKPTGELSTLRTNEKRGSRARGLYTDLTRMA